MDSANSAWPKYHAPPDMLTVESRLQTMQLTPDQVREQMMEVIDQQMAVAKTPEEKQAWANIKVKKYTKRLMKKIKEAFVEDFILWIDGRSPYNVVSRKEAGIDKNGNEVEKIVKYTPWGNKSMSFIPGAADLLESPILNRDKVIKTLTKLICTNPRNVDELWIYYKYIVRKVGIDINENTVKEQHFYNDYDYLEKNPMKIEEKPVYDKYGTRVPGELQDVLVDDPRYKELSTDNPKPEKFDQDKYYLMKDQVFLMAKEGRTDIIETNEFAGLSPEDKLYMLQIARMTAKRQLIESVKDKEYANEIQEIFDTIIPGIDARQEQEVIEDVVELAGKMKNKKRRARYMDKLARLLDEASGAEPKAPVPAKPAAAAPPPKAPEPAPVDADAAAREARRVRMEAIKASRAAKAAKAPEPAKPAAAPPPKVPEPAKPAPAAPPPKAPEPAKPAAPPPPKAPEPVKPAPAPEPAKRPIEIDPDTDKALEDIEARVGRYQRDKATFDEVDKKTVIESIKGRTTAMQERLEKRVADEVTKYMADLKAAGTEPEKLEITTKFMAISDDLRKKQKKLDDALEIIDKEAVPEPAVDELHETTKNRIQLDEDLLDYINKKNTYDQEISRNKLYALRERFDNVEDEIKRREDETKKKIDEIEKGDWGSEEVKKIQREEYDKILETTDMDLAYILGGRWRLEKEIEEAIGAKDIKPPKLDKAIKQKYFNDLKEFVKKKTEVGELWQAYGDNETFKNAKRKLYQDQYPYHERAIKGEHEQEYRKALNTHFLKDEYFHYLEKYNRPDQPREAEAVPPPKVVKPKQIDGFAKAYNEARAGGIITAELRKDFIGYIEKRETMYEKKLTRFDKIIDNPKSTPEQIEEAENKLVETDSRRQEWRERVKHIDGIAANDVEIRREAPKPAPEPAKPAAAPPIKRITPIPVPDYKRREERGEVPQDTTAINEKIQSIKKLQADYISGKGTEEQKAKTYETIERRTKKLVDDAVDKRLEFEKRRSMLDLEESLLTGNKRELSKIDEKRMAIEREEREFEEKINTASVNVVDSVERAILADRNKQKSFKPRPRPRPLEYGEDPMQGFKREYIYMKAMDRNPDIQEKGKARDAHYQEYIDLGERFGKHFNHINHLYLSESAELKKQIKDNKYNPVKLAKLEEQQDLIDGKFERFMKEALEMAPVVVQSVIEGDTEDYEWDEPEKVKPKNVVEPLKPKTKDEERQERLNAARKAQELKKPEQEDIHMEDIPEPAPKVPEPAKPAAATPPPKAPEPAKAPEPVKKKGNLTGLEQQEIAIREKAEKEERDRREKEEKEKARKALGEEKWIEKRNLAEAGLTPQQKLDKRLAEIKEEANNEPDNVKGAIAIKEMAMKTGLIEMEGTIKALENNIKHSTSSGNDREIIKITANQKELEDALREINKEAAKTAADITKGLNDFDMTALLEKIPIHEKEARYGALQGGVEGRAMMNKYGVTTTKELFNKALFYEALHNKVGDIIGEYQRRENERKKVVEGPGHDDWELFKVLGLKTDNPQLHDIARAFKAASIRLHSDRAIPALINRKTKKGEPEYKPTEQDLKEIQEAFTKVKEAHDYLKEGKQREAYISKQKTPFKPR